MQPSPAITPRTLFEHEHDMFRDSYRRFVQKEIGPHTERWREQGYVDREAFRKSGEHGYPADVGRREVRRRRHPRLSLRAGDDRGEPALRRHRLLQHAALAARRSVHRRARQRGAEAALPAALCPGRVHPRDRDDGAGRGQRSRRHEDARRGSRRSLGAQRLEDVHLERPDRRPHHRRGAHGAGQDARPRPVPRREPTCRASSAAAT